MKSSLFLILFIFVISLAFTQDTTFQRFYYLGMVGEYAVQLELTLNGDEVTGSYYYNTIGTLIELRGKATGDVTSLLFRPDRLEPVKPEGHFSRATVCKNS